MINKENEKKKNQTINISLAPPISCVGVKGKRKRKTSRSRLIKAFANFFSCFLRSLFVEGPGAFQEGISAGSSLCFTAFLGLCLMPEVYYTSNAVFYVPLSQQLLSPIFDIRPFQVFSSASSTSIDISRYRTVSTPPSDFSPLHSSTLKSFDCNLLTRIQKKK